MKRSMVLLWGEGLYRDSLALSLTCECVRDVGHGAEVSAQEFRRALGGVEGDPRAVRKHDHSHRCQHHSHHGKTGYERTATTIVTRRRTSTPNTTTTSTTFWFLPLLVLHLRIPLVPSGSGRRRPVAGGCVSSLVFWWPRGSFSCVARRASVREREEERPGR